MLLFSAEQMFLEQTGSGRTGYVMKEPNLIESWDSHAMIILCVCLKIMMH